MGLTDVPMTSVCVRATGDRLLLRLLKRFAESDPSLPGDQDLERRNVELAQRVENVELTLASSKDERDQARREVHRAVDILDVKIFDLNDLRQSLAKLLDK